MDLVPVLANPTDGEVSRFGLVGTSTRAKDHYIRPMCGRVIQSGGPLRYTIVDGMNVRDSRVHNPTAVDRDRILKGTAANDVGGLQ